MEERKKTRERKTNGRAVNHVNEIDKQQKSSIALQRIDYVKSDT